MTLYELTFIARKAEDVAPLEKLLKSFDGKKRSEKAWGKIPFAYPIEKDTAGEYYTWEIEIPREKLNDFKIKLNYENLLIRYLFLTIDPKKVKAVKSSS